jgi:hypothetical protein
MKLSSRKRAMLKTTTINRRRLFLAAVRALAARAISPIGAPARRVPSVRFVHGERVMRTDALDIASSLDSSSAGPNEPTCDVGSGIGTS